MNYLKTIHRLEARIRELEEELSACQKRQSDMIHKAAPESRGGRFSVAECYCTLAKKYDPGKHNVLGWSVSEKVDGVRAVWCPDRKGFFSRSNKPLIVPGSWLSMMESVPVPLDGEFFMGRGRFQDTVSAVRKKNPTEEDFKDVQYVVFDSITEGPHSARLVRAHAALPASFYPKLYVLAHTTVTCMDLIGIEYTKLLAIGGEGLMFRNPAAGYEMKRTGNLLKWKDEIDGTALITGVDEGQGKHTGRIGAMVCVCNETGVCFRVGTGLTDEERERTDWVGRTIRWRAMERTRDNIPRHPAFVAAYEGD